MIPVLVTVLTAALVGASGVAALVRFAPLLPAMDRVGVPRSWLVFPIGVLKILGALGLLVGLLGVPLVGCAAAAGLVLFFACAVHTHLLAGDRSTQLGFALAFLAFSAATFAASCAT